MVKNTIHCQKVIILINSLMVKKPTDMQLKHM